MLGLPNFELVAIPSDAEFFRYIAEQTNLTAPLEWLDEGVWKLGKDYLASLLSDLYRFVLVHLDGGTYSDISIQVCAQDPPAKKRPALSTKPISPCSSRFPAETDSRGRFFSE